MSDGMSFKVEFDAEELLGRFVSENAKKVLLDDIKADSSKYVPYRTGTLHDSAVVDVSDGSVSWTTEYAQAMYERDKVGSTKNDKSTGHWFETAKENHIDQWTQDVKDALFSR